MSREWRVVAGEKSTQYSVPSTQYSVLSTQYSVLGTQYDFPHQSPHSPALLPASFQDRAQPFDRPDGAQHAVLQRDIVLFLKGDPDGIVPDFLGVFPHGAEVLQATAHLHGTAAEIHDV